MIRMSALADRFAALRATGERALVPFVTAGDPPLDQLPAILDALVEAGADAIEVGVPFSDPIADGPTIQASSQRALDRGVTPSAVLDVLASWEGEAPLILMGYLNPALRMGLPGFAHRASKAGVSAVILSDLIPEESGDWLDASREHGIDAIFLAAPTSTDQRLDAIAGAASGFVYAISRTGVTGAGQQAPPEVAALVGRIRERTHLPVCVGFGISAPAHVRMVCEVADGAVVGSWLVDLLASEWRDGAGRARVVAAVAELKAATRF